MDLFIIENPYAKIRLMPILTEQEEPLLPNEKVEIKRKRCRSLNPNKTYARVHKNKKATHSMFVTVYIGLEIFKLLKFDPLKPVSIFFSNTNKDILEINQNITISGYKCAFGGSPNAVNFRFSLPEQLHFHPTDTVEIPYDFANDNSLLLNLGKMNV